MSDTADLLVLQARIADLEHRLQHQEAITTGRTWRHADLRLLTELYQDALMGPMVDDESGRHWERHVMNLTVHQLVIMGRGVGDPFPWRPILRNLDLMIKYGIDLTKARSHLLSIAQELLEAQGLRLLSPRDLMGHVIPDMRKLSA